jgi:hypothetical protein
LVLNGCSTIEGAVDYDVHSDLIHRHLELSARVRGHLFRRHAAGELDMHLDVYFVQ